MLAGRPGVPGTSIAWRLCALALVLPSWSATCDTVHAHSQVLGKLAASLAPPELQLQHAALRLTARGWETQPLPVPDRSGSVVVALNLHAHQAIIEHSDGRRRSCVPPIGVGRRRSMRGGGCSTWR